MVQSIRRPISLLLAGLLACGGDGIGGPEATQLARAERLWNRSGVGARSYTMQQRRVCFCLDGDMFFEITVSGGTISRVVHASTGEPLPASFHARFRTVEALFAEIQAATGRGVLTGVEYDPTLGYPARVSLDPIPAAADDEVTYITRNVLPKP